MNEIGLNSKRIINFKNSPEISNPQTPQTNAVNVENSQTVELPEIYRHSYTEPTKAKDTIKLENFFTKNEFLTQFLTLQ